MHFSLIVMLASAYTQASFGGTLEIINIDNQCVIWSYNNHGCTGSSTFFSQLNRNNCSNKVANSTHSGYPLCGAEACGMENNSSAAWVKVEKPGVITFYNFQGDKLTCTLDNELKHSSWCTASALIPSTKSSSTESASTKSSSTKSSSTKSSSALTMLDSLSSTIEPSLTTFQTAPILDCSAI
ncbi:unnamed protein product [Penicillium salamii]|nr:unnamed protein product [Penicillium salamii]